MAGGDLPTLVRIADPFSNWKPPYMAEWLLSISDKKATNFSINYRILFRFRMHNIATDEFRVGTRLRIWEESSHGQLYELEDPHRQR